MHDSQVTTPESWDTHPVSCVYSRMYAWLHVVVVAVGVHARVHSIGVLCSHGHGLLAWAGLNQRRALQHRAWVKRLERCEDDASCVAMHLTWPCSQIINLRTGACKEALAMAATDRAQWIRDHGGNSLFNSIVDSVTGSEAWKNRPFDSIIVLAAGSEEWKRA
jgi:hypothetical protein